MLKQTPLYVSLNNSIAGLLDQVANGVKSVFTFNKQPLVEELKLKVCKKKTANSEVTVKMLTQQSFDILGHLVKKLPHRFFNDGLTV